MPFLTFAERSRWLASVEPDAALLTFGSYVADVAEAGAVPDGWAVVCLLRSVAEQEARDFIALRGRAGIAAPARSARELVSV